MTTKRRRTTRASRAVDAMMERKCDLRTLRQPGTYLDVQEKAALDLAREIHKSESDDVATSWSAQERAQDYYNEHGLIATLDEMFRLRAISSSSAT